MSDTVMETPAGMEQLQSDLAKMEANLAASRARQKKLKNFSLLASIIIVVVFAVYIGLFYKLFAKNLAAERFAESAQTHITQMAPVFIQTSQEVLKEASPAYIEAVQKKSETFVPDLAKRLELQSDLFLANMSRFAKEEFERRLVNVVQFQANEFKKTFPDLTDAQIDRFVAETSQELEVVFYSLTEHIISQTLPEITEMKGLVEDMAAKGLPDEEVLLFRMFLQKSFMLIDSYFTEGQP